MLSVGLAVWFDMEAVRALEEHRMMNETVVSDECSRVLR